MKYEVYLKNQNAEGRIRWLTTTHLEEVMDELIQYRSGQYPNVDQLHITVSKEDDMTEQHPERTGFDIETKEGGIAHSFAPSEQGTEPEQPEEDTDGGQ